jgi:hypothetical protein
VGKNEILVFDIKLISISSNTPTETGSTDTL